jgi:hypothetical protein
LDVVNAPEQQAPVENVGMARGKEVIEQYANSHAIND